MTFNPCLLKIDSNFPVGSAKPNVKEHITLGWKMKNLTNNKEEKNMAIAAIAVGAIFLVGALFSFSVGNVVLSSVFSYLGLVSAVSGSIYFVIKNFFDPVQKVEDKKEKMRFLPFKEVLNESLDDIEGYELLEKRIQDKKLGPQEKEKIYLSIRQLKRNYEKLKTKKKDLEQTVDASCELEVEKLNQQKNEKIRDIYVQNAAKNPPVPPAVTNADIELVNQLCKKAVETCQNWKQKSHDVIEENYRSSIEKLSKAYEKIFEKDTMFSFIGRLPLLDRFIS